MSSPAKMQTVGEATSSIKGIFQSTFSSLASSLNLPQLRDSFFQNIILSPEMVIFNIDRTT